ncbi:SET domain-containing protein [Venturia nashicola]|nr:SET domain-containing protein [Venturia nashicola]
MEFNNATLASTAISALQDISPPSSPAAPSSQSTPPTSLGDVNSEIDPFKEDREAREAEVIRRRSRRSRPSVPTYNDNVRSGTAAHIRRASRQRYEIEAESSTRSFSGATLVEDQLEIPKSSKILKELRIDANWAPADEMTARYLKGHADGDDSEDDRPVVYSVWSMGKLVTETVKATKEKILERKESKRAQKEENANDRIRRLFPNLKIPETSSNKDESKVVEKTAEATKPTQAIRRTPAVRASHTPKPAKQAPAEGPKTKPVASKAKGRKKYLSQGLYVGQHRNFDPKLSEAKNRKRLQGLGIPEENRALPLPMFLGEEMLKQDEDYKLPFEILNPLRFEEHPKDWNKLNKNRFIGEASAAWKKSNLKKSVYSPCGCQGDRCDDTCLNRIFKYECNDDLCGIGPSCGNRPFAELAFRARCKNWHRKQEGEKYEANLWGEGVEVMRAGERGHGVRAMRPFEPHQIIVEYCGEIITQDESDRRMNNDYKGKNDYYLMTFKDSLIIDATRGSICRFVNHSCEPNCYVEMWKVNGEPRMGLFAGEDGIFTGEELTYDYNFEVYSEDNVQVCLCGSENCRGILGPKTLQQKKKSRASKTMDTVKAAVQGVKRKAKEMIGLQEDSESDSDDESSRPKRRRIADPRSMLGKVGRQSSNVSSGSEPAVQPMSGAELAAQKQSREERALKRSSSLMTANSRVTEGMVTKSRRSKASFHVSGVPQAIKALNRRSMPAPRDPSPSTSEDESDSDPSTPVSVSPQVKAPKPRVFDLPAGILKRGEDLFKAAMGSFVAGDVPSSTAPNRTKNIPPGSLLGMRQAKLSFGSTGGLVLKSSPAKPKPAAVAEEEEVVEEEEEEVVVKGPKIPKRGSSLGGSKAARARKAVVVAKHGVLGEAGVKKSIRLVSGGA